MMRSLLLVVLLLNSSLLTPAKQAKKINFQKPTFSFEQSDGTFSTNARPTYTEAGRKVGHGELYYQQGKLDLNNQDYTEAEKNLKLAVERSKRGDEDRAEYFHYYALALCANQKFAKAVKIARKGLKSYPKHLETIKDLAYALAKQGNWDEAVEWHEKMVDMEPERTSNHYHLADNYVKLERWNDATHNLEVVVEKESKNGKAWGLLGMAYSSIKDYQSALQPLLNAYKLEPDDATNFAIVLCYEGMTDWEKAVEWNKKLTRKNPENEYYMAKAMALKMSLDTDGLVTAEVKVSMPEVKHPIEQLEQMEKDGIKTFPQSVGVGSGTKVDAQTQTSEELKVELKTIPKKELKTEL